VMKRKKFDLTGPAATAMRDEIVHGAFLTQGAIAAFPLCFPGVTTPIPHEESRITALTVTSDGVIYGGTSGGRAHCFVAMFHGATGFVFDLGGAEGTASCPGICCTRQKVVAAVHSGDAACLIRFPLQGLPFDLLQEWGFNRPEMETVPLSPDAGSIVWDVASDPTQRDAVIVATDTGLWRVADNESEAEAVAVVPVSGRLLNLGTVLLGRDSDESLWICDVQTGNVARRAVQLPRDIWEGDEVTWCRDPLSGGVYVVSATGGLYRFCPKTMVFGSCLGRVPLSPVTAMAATTDGRLFGACGDGISKMFCFDPAKCSVDLIGVPVSVLGRRRYGYCFGAAVCGRDGHLVFGENDNSGHLWVYFPSITGVGMPCPGKEVNG